MLTGEHEVFYRQDRRVQNRIFGILKFATMLKNSPKHGFKRPYHAQ
ncbi:MAG: sugar transferase [Chitinophagaceae bacterium]|nr:sugar transferase [Chitinophagaceae bacterium]